MSVAPVSVAPQCNLVAPMSCFSRRDPIGLRNLTLRSSMGSAELAVKRPPANIASIIPVGLMEVGAGVRRPVDILPEIDIPVDF